MTEENKIYTLRHKNKLFKYKDKDGKYVYKKELRFSCTEKEFKKIAKKVASAISNN